MDSLKRILWLDDDFFTPALQTEQDELYSRGYFIIKATNTNEFYEALQKRDFECIVLDISLPIGPKMDPRETHKGLRTGLVILKSILQDESLSSVPIIVYSIINDYDVKVFCKENDVKYIDKFEASPWTLADELDSLLTGSR